MNSVNANNIDFVKAFIDKEVVKTSGKPFKSGLKTNKVKGVEINPLTGNFAFSFYEDDSVVDCHQCELSQFSFLNNINKDKPYKIEYVEVRSYNPEYGDERMCKCGHTYYRHFDTYDNMEACGCKYCSCFTFEEAIKNE